MFCSLSYTYDYVLLTQLYQQKNVYITMQQTSFSNFIYLFKCLFTVDIYISLKVLFNIDQLKR